MDNMINFGIDLGTTNSLIAKYAKGNVTVYKNPKGQKEVLPSVVGFRKDKILIGDQARTFAEKEPLNVASRFKRKMGTTEVIQVESLSQTKTPVELSAFVLKELKTFVHTGEAVDAAVITIPASFDMIQSNATKEAGIQAGFKQVILLQEPIAASLAYANMRKDKDLRNSQWLVYDLGGGTFDVALIKIVDGELKVLDHEGDNFLGGTDFDAMMVERFVIPHLEELGEFDSLENELKSASGIYNALWYSLLHAAEHAKIELSSATSAELMLNSPIEDDSGTEHDLNLTITRSEFEQIIRPEVDRTADMVKRILTRNSLRPADLQFVLMVGGSTFIPYVRSRIGELLGVPVNCDVDPITAVAVGAAYFAGTREKKFEALEKHAPAPGRLRVKAVYNRVTQDAEELFSARIEGDLAGLHYRITREDGAYDSGLKKLAERISEDLPVRDEETNVFLFTVTDTQGNPVVTDLSPVQITRGKVFVAGQPLPNDICLVFDDFIKERAALRPLLRRGELLPTKAKKTVTANRSVRRGSDDDLKIIVVEGSEDGPPAGAGKRGYLSISGKMITRDIPKGAELELVIEMSESRDLTVSAIVLFSNDSFSQVFKAQQMAAPPELLTQELVELHDEIETEIAEAEKLEKYEAARELVKLKDSAMSLAEQTAAMSEDDVTDAKFKVEAQKRELARSVFELTKNRQVELLRAEYQEAKARCAATIQQHGNDSERRQLNELVGDERVVLASSNPEKLRHAISQLRGIEITILRRTPKFLMEIFESLVDDRQRLNDQVQAKSLIDAGRLAIHNENWDRLDEVISGLINLLPDDEKADRWRGFTGIS